ncbi:uncharacterized protein LOC132305302 [Cornus florida]|uniref:uncharacterized protein LOC132305302 n=1 Tax=Cornus florida TaxID=4283 RepID=UPI0028966CF0|nr:uncharacterized protein LOC132305302 [Cornus florida]
MAQTHIPTAPVTAPVAQMTVPQVAPMPTIQQVQNPPPVAFPQQTWHDQPGQPWPYHNPQAQQNVPPVNIQPAAPVPARPPMVIPMAEFGLTRRGGRPTYRKSYPEFIDKVEFLRNFRILKFATFNGKGEQSTLEHISRFTVQYGEAAANPWLKFYRAELEVSMADLSRLHQLPGESVMSFLSRFRRAKFKCNLSLPLEEYMKMAVNGLEFELRKKFEGVQFHDLFDLAGKVAKYEELLREEQDMKNSSKGTYYRDPNYEVYTIETEGGFEVNVAELNIKKAYTCEALTKPKSATANLQAASGSKWKGADSSRSYSFDISKAEKIFDLLMADKQLIFTAGYKMSSASEIAEKEYCKFHNSWKHSTNNCVIFRNIVQKAIEDGRLKFPKKSEVIGVDGNPFPKVVTTSVASTILEHSKRRWTW